MRMYDFDLARLIQADRERDIARDLRAHALREARADQQGETFVPEPTSRPARLSHAVRLVPGAHRGG